MLQTRSSGAEEPEEPTSWCSLRTVLAGAFFATIATVLVLVFGVFGHVQVISTFLRLVPEDPGWGTALVIASVNFTVCIFCLAFWALGQMVMAFVFGFYWGCLLNYVTLICASMASFCIGRYLFRDSIRRSLLNYPQASKAAKMIEKEEVKFLILFRALPIPLFLKNYLPPVLKVSPWAVLLSVVVSGAIYCPIFAMIGAGSQSLAALYVKDEHLVLSKGFKWDPTQITLACVAVVAMIGMMVFATLEWRKVSNELEPLDPDGMPREQEEDPLRRRSARSDDAKEQ